MRTLIGLAFLFVFCSCNRDKEKVSYRLDTSFQLGTEQFASEQSGRMKIEIISIDDSRCPEGVLCFWEGEGIVNLLITKARKETNASLSTHPERPSEINFEGHVIKLLELSPYPKAEEKIDQIDYRATLIVTKD